jgi:hypothetical protein
LSLTIVLEFCTGGPAGMFYHVRSSVPDTLASRLHLLKEQWLCERHAHLPAACAALLPFSRLTFFAELR